MRVSLFYNLSLFVYKGWTHFSWRAFLDKLHLLVYTTDKLPWHVCFLVTATEPFAHETFLVLPQTLSYYGSCYGPSKRFTNVHHLAEVTRNDVNYAGAAAVQSGQLGRHFPSVKSQVRHLGCPWVYSREYSWWLLVKMTPLRKSAGRRLSNLYAEYLRSL